MKRLYWGFNWTVTAFTGQFGLFIRYKNGYRYIGFGLLSLPLVLLWLMWAKDNSEYINLFDEG